MEIRDKSLLREEIWNKIHKYVQEFPIYFYGNIIINLLLSAVILASFLAGVAMVRLSPDMTYWGIVIAIAVGGIFRITLRGFFRNIKILHRIQTGDYEFGIEDHEMDNAIELIEDLPMKKEDIERLKNALSFGKLVDVLETAHIITCQHDMYSLDLIFKYSIEKKSGQELYH